jgi:small subunit ribosomal protein S19e
MVRTHDVPADRLIETLAEHLKRVPEMEPTLWSQLVKTGSHTERPPQQQNWWYVRAASILRKLYFHGPLGINDFESIYGSSKQISYSPKHHRDAGSSIIRTILRQLEQAGLVTKQGNKGRVLTPKAISQLDKLSKDIFKELVKKDSEFARYG